MQSFFFLRVRTTAQIIEYSKVLWDNSQNGRASRCWHQEKHCQSQGLRPGRKNRMRKSNNVSHPSRPANSGFSLVCIGLSQDTHGLCRNRELQRPLRRGDALLRALLRRSRLAGLARDLFPGGFLHVLLEQDLHDIRRGVLVLGLLREARGRDLGRTAPLGVRSPLAHPVVPFNRVLVRLPALRLCTLLLPEMARGELLHSSGLVERLSGHELL